VEFVPKLAMYRLCIEADEIDVTLPHARRPSELAERLKSYRRQVGAQFSGDEIRVQRLPRSAQERYTSLVAEVYESLPVSEVEGVMRLGVALADPVRQSVLMRLASGPAYPKELASIVGTSPSNLSNHLACLRGCGLVSADREGRRIRYSLANPALGAALKAIIEVVCECEVTEADSA
jgi:DNA-binding transcriptional ArsR family regulator